MKREKTWMENSAMSTPDAFKPAPPIVAKGAGVPVEPDEVEGADLPLVEAVAPVQTVEAVGSATPCDEQALETAEATHNETVEALKAAHERVKAAVGEHREQQKEYADAIEESAEGHIAGKAKQQITAHAAEHLRNLEVGKAVITKLSAKWARSAAAERKALARLRAIQSARHAAAIPGLREQITAHEAQIADLRTGIGETEASRAEAANESARLDAENREAFGMFAGTISEIKAWATSDESGINPLQLTEALAGFENFKTKRYAGSRNEIEIRATVSRAIILFSRQTGELSESHPEELLNDNGEKWDFDSGMVKSSFKLRARLADLNRMGANG